MATTRIADIYEPLTFAETISERAIELNAFINSGVAVQDPLIDAQASVGGRIGDLTGNAPLTNVDPNISSDDPGVTSTPQKLSQKTQKWRLSALNQSWSSMDLARELSSVNPVAGITDKISHYWATVWQKRVIAKTEGIIADNVANNSSDMVVDVSIEDGNNAVAANIISANTVLDAKQTLGDSANSLAVIAMHSVVFTALEKQNLIQYIPNSEGMIGFPTYLKYRVIVDDLMTVTAGTTSGFKYTTLLFSSGAIGYGSGRVTKPTAREDKEDSGNGGGEEILYSRESKVYHPYGFSFIDTGVAAESPTVAELKTAAHWERKFDRKNCGIAALITNG